MTSPNYGRGIVGFKPDSGGSTLGPFAVANKALTTRSIPETPQPLESKRGRSLLAQTNTKPTP